MDIENSSLKVKLSSSKKNEDDEEESIEIRQLDKSDQLTRKNSQSSHSDTSFVNAVLGDCSGRISSEYGSTHDCPSKFDDQTAVINIGNTTSDSSAHLDGSLKEAFDHEMELLRSRKNSSLNLFRFMLLLIFIISIVINTYFVFKVYQGLTEEHLKKFPEYTPETWRLFWLFNAVLSTLTLLVGFLGVIFERIILLSISSISFLLNLLVCEPDLAPPVQRKIFNLPLLVILFTVVLMIIFVAKLRVFSEERMNLITRYNCRQYISAGFAQFA